MVVGNCVGNSMNLFPSSLLDYKGSGQEPESMSLLGRSWTLRNRSLCVLWTIQPVPAEQSPKFPHTYKHTRCEFAHHI